MNQYFKYELDPDNPLLPFMQDTSVEDSLSYEELDDRYRTQLAGILFSMYEGAEFNEHEKNYFIYSALNDIEPDVVSYNVLKYIHNIEPNLERAREHRRICDELYAKGLL